MKDIWFDIIIVLIIAVVGCALTAAIVNSDLPLWLKIVLLK